MTKLQKATTLQWKRQWSREFSLYKTETAMISLFSRWAKEFLGRRLKNVIAFKEDNNAALYTGKDEFQKGLNFLYNLSCKDWKSFKKFINSHLSIEKRFLQFSKNVYKADLSQLSNKDLARLLNDFAVINTEHSLISQWTVFYVAEILPEKVQEEVGQVIKDPNKIEEYVGTILTPSRHSQIVKEHLGLLDLAADYKSKKISKNELDKLLDSHTTKYQWIPVIDIWDKSWDKKYFRKEFTKVTKGNPRKELNSVIKRLKNGKEAWEKLIRIKTWNRKQKLLFKMAHSVAFYKDDRDDKRRKAYFYLKKMYQQIAKRLDISLRELGFLIHEEIISCLRRGCISTSLIKSIKDRQKFFLLVVQNQKLKVFSGKRGKSLLGRLLKERSQKGVKQISGKIAFSGKVEGAARIIKARADLKKIKPRDIMVAITTHPNFVPSMKKCSAIVTDEGGIISHAAIVSREFKIPCIVGTKIATAVLRDGDLVEVDANKGIVRILK